jgi:hypothetical protein
MISENEVRERLARYLRGEIALEQFEDWLVQRSWNMHRDSEPAAQKLVAAIELRLAEHSSGHLDEPSLRSELVPLVSRTTSEISFGGGLPAWASGSSNYLIARRVIQIAVPDRRVLRPAVAESADRESAAAPG